MSKISRFFAYFAKKNSQGDRPPADHATVEELIRHYGRETTTKKQVTYAVYTQFRSGMNYLQKPYALANATPLLARLRKIIGCLLAGLGILGLLASSILHDQAQS